MRMLCLLSFLAFKNSWPEHKNIRPPRTEHSGGLRAAVSHFLGNGTSHWDTPPRFWRPSHLLQRTAWVDFDSVPSGTGDDSAAVHRTDLHSTAGEDGRIFAGQV